MLTLQPFLQGEDITEIKKKLLDEPYRLPGGCTRTKNLQGFTGYLYESTTSITWSPLHQCHNILGRLAKISPRRGGCCLLVFWLGKIYPMEQPERVPDYFLTLRHCRSRHIRFVLYLNRRKLLLRKKTAFAHFFGPAIFTNTTIAMIIF